MRTNKKHFDIFKKECQYWQNRLELNNWEIRFSHGGASDWAYATTRITKGANSSSIFLTNDWPEDTLKLSPDNLRGVAKHEVMHVLLARFSSNANARFTSHGEMEEAEEELVIKLVGLIT